MKRYAIGFRPNERSALGAERHLGLRAWSRDGIDAKDKGGVTGGDEQRDERLRTHCLLPINGTVDAIRLKKKKKKINPRASTVDETMQLEMNVATAKANATQFSCSHSSPEDWINRTISAARPTIAAA